MYSVLDIYAIYVYYGCARGSPRTPLKIVRPGVLPADWS